MTWREIIEPLTDLDSYFLQIETPRHPMHWALIIALNDSDPAISFTDLRDRVRERFVQYELFRLGIVQNRWQKPKRVVWPDWDPLRNMSLHWAADPSAVQLRLNHLMATPIDAAGPLWQLELIEQESPRRQLLVLRVHHCLSDGLAGTGFGVLFADGDPRKIRDFERFLVSDNFSPATDALDKDPVMEFTKLWLSGATLRRQLPRISRNGDRAIAYGKEAAGPVRAAAAENSASLPEHLIAVTGEVLGRRSEKLRGNVRLGVAVSLDDSLRHTGNATSLNFTDVPPWGSRSERVASIKQQNARAQRSHLELAWIVSLERGRNLPWPIQRAVSRATSNLFRFDASVTISPILVTVDSVLGSRVAGVFGFVSPARMAITIVYLLSGSHVSFGITADPHVIPVSVDQIARELSTRLTDAIPQVEVQR